MLKRYIENKENFPYFFLDLYIIKYIMNLVLDSKLVLLQTHYWLVHSPHSFCTSHFFLNPLPYLTFFFSLKNDEQSRT